MCKIFLIVLTRFEVEYFADAQKASDVEMFHRTRASTH